MSGFKKNAFKQNNPGCCGCGCAGECLSSGGLPLQTTASEIRIELDNIPDTFHSGDFLLFGQPAFARITGFQSVEGTYIANSSGLPDCGFISSGSLTPSDFTATGFLKSDCGPGPYSGTSLTIVSGSYLMLWDGTSSNILSPGRQGLVLRFTFSIRPSPFSITSVGYEFYPEDPGLLCAGGNLAGFALNDPNPCQGFGNTLTSDSTYELTS
jgi:hypothetical protein